MDETFSVEIFQAVKDLSGVGGHYRVPKRVFLVKFEKRALGYKLKKDVQIRPILQHTK